jgi:hypothetical protein
VAFSSVDPMRLHCENCQQLYVGGDI